MEKIKNRINAHFLDSSLPPMVMLDGKWGSGKTYFIKNYYNKNNTEADSSKLGDKKTIFFSLYGINSLDDFKDKLLSFSLIERGDGGKIITHTKSLLSSISNSLGPETTGALSVVGSLAGAFKHSYLNDISNVILILDDLERLEDSKLQGQILGECLELAEEKGFYVLVLANSEKITERAMLEKCFSELITFELPHKVVFENSISHINFTLLERAILESYSFRFKNQRALKRGINQIKKIWSSINNKESIHFEESFSNICRLVLAITYAKYELNADLETVIHFGSMNLVKRKVEILKRDEVSSDQKEVKQYLELFRNIIYDEDVFRMIFYGDYQFENPIEDLGLVKIHCKYWKLVHCDLTRVKDQNDFDEQISELRSYLFIEKKLDCSEWLIAADIYVELIKKRYLNENLNIELSTLEKRIVIENFDTGSAGRISKRGDIESELHTFKPKLLSIAKDIDRKYSMSLIVEKFKDDVYSAILLLNGKKDYEVIFDCFDSQYIFELIESNWNHTDFINFTNYLINRYEYYLVDDFKSELNFFSELNKLLVDTTFSSSLKNGALINLKSQLITVVDILKRL